MSTRPDRQVLIFGSQSAMKEFVISRWRELSARMIDKYGFFRVALSGGKTPAPLYERLSEENGLYWDKTLIFQVDERFVPEDDPDNNFRMIRRTLIDRIPIPGENLFPIPVNAPGPLKAAEQYETLIRENMGLAEGQFPRFDMVLLGIGKDGHTASLFPGDEALFETRKIAVAVIPEKGHSRITLTLPSINMAGHIFFFVVGKEKAAVFKKAATGDPAVPAALVKPIGGELVFISDPDAGSELK